MKKLFRYFSIATLFIALSAIVTSCLDNENGGDGSGLNIKVFAPTVVVPGYPMTINGTGFKDVTEIVFPGDIVVKDFEIVTNEMIRVKAPAGLSQEGTITVRNSFGETATSRLPLTLGHTSITGYSVDPDDETIIIKGNELFTVYGKDMTFVTGVQFIDEDNNPVYIPASEFYRLAPGRIVIQVPEKVLTGKSTVKIFYGGQEFETPEFNFETAKNAGHWEEEKVYLWKNPGLGGVSWNGTYRFANEQTKSGEECHTFTMDEWDIIKDGEFYFEYTGDASSNVRVTTGWWSGAYGGTDHNCIDLATPNEDGNMVIKLNLNEDHNIYDLVDAQHLLFTGDAYTPYGIYILERKWVDGDAGHFETIRTSLWKNGEQSTIPAPNWSGEGRFACVKNVSGEETYAFSEEEWEIIKNEEFCVLIEAIDNPNVRITSGWWSSDYGGKEYNCFELAEPAEGNTYVIPLKLSNYPELQDLVDVQHLLFTGSGYKVLEIFQEKQVWVAGEGGPKEVVMWEGDGSAGVINWDGKYRFGLEGNDGNNECIATLPAEHWDVIKNGSFFLEAQGSDWVQMRITTGWWSTTWTGEDITTGSDRIETLENGKYRIEINFKGDPILDVLDAQHLLFTGGGYTPLKLYYVK